MDAWQKSRSTAGLGPFRTLFTFGTLGGLTDQELLDRFVSRRDEDAFAALIHRHAPLVLRVCVAVLRDPHDAEDASQATFLILARKAASIRRRSSMGSWLFGVARRVAVRARTDLTRRRELEQRGAEMAARHVENRVSSESWAEVWDELERLPEKYRSPIILCDLEGLTPRAGCGAAPPVGPDDPEAPCRRSGDVASPAGATAVLSTRPGAECRARSRRDSGGGSDRPGKRHSPGRDADHVGPGDGPRDLRSGRLLGGRGDCGDVLDQAQGGHGTRVDPRARRHRSGRLRTQPVAGRRRPGPGDRNPPAPDEPSRRRPIPGRTSAASPTISRTIMRSCVRRACCSRRRTWIDP